MHWHLTLHLLHFLPGVDFLWIEVVEGHCAQLFNMKINLYSPQSSIKSWAQKSWKRSSTIWPKKGGKKLGVRNCAQLPINKKSTPELGVLYALRRAPNFYEIQPYTVFKTVILSLTFLFALQNDEAYLK
jgi:hypothetical protein